MKERIPDIAWANRPNATFTCSTTGLSYSRPINEIPITQNSRSCPRPKENLCILEGQEDNLICEATFNIFSLSVEIFPPKKQIPLESRKTLAPKHAATKITASNISMLSVSMTKWSQKAAGVFVDSLLPRALRSDEIGLHPGDPHWPLIRHYFPAPPLYLEHFFHRLRCPVRLVLEGEIRGKLIIHCLF